MLPAVWNSWGKVKSLLDQFVRLSLESLPLSKLLWGVLPNLLKVSASSVDKFKCEIQISNYRGGQRACKFSTSRWTDTNETVLLIAGGICPQFTVYSPANQVASKDCGFSGVLAVKGSFSHKYFMKGHPSYLNSTGSDPNSLQLAAEPNSVVAYTIKHKFVTANLVTREQGYCQNKYL